MFRLFKKKKTANKSEEFADKAAGSIHRRIHQLQTRFAKAMSHQEQKLNQMQKKIALVMFCSIMGGLSGWWLYQGVFMQAKSQPGVFNQDNITRPEVTTLPDSLDLNMLEEYLHMQELHEYLPDSITP